MRLLQRNRANTMIAAYFNIRQMHPELTPAQAWILAGIVAK